MSANNINISSSISSQINFFHVEPSSLEIELKDVAINSLNI